MNPHLKNIIDEWFVLEPALFTAFFTHKVVENTTMSIPFRVGEMRLECNPSLIEDMSEAEVEARLRYEMIRILLGHPYQRQPRDAQAELLTLASNCTIFGNYRSTKYLDCGDMGFQRGLSFEEYYALLKELMPQTPGKGGSADEKSNKDNKENDDIYKLAKESKLPYSSLNNIFVRKTSPTIPTLEKICDGFDITLSEFFRQEDEAVELSEDQKLLLERYKRFDKNQRLILISYMDALDRMND